MNRQTAKEKATALVAQMTVAEAASQLRFDAPAIDRLGIPAYNWWNEALHGVARAGTATSFPQAIGMAATFDPQLVRELGDIASTEARAKYNAQSAHDDRDIYKGLTLWSPNVNIFRDPRWGRGHETYGEDPVLTAELGTAYVKGIQGEGETLKAAACAKHYAVHSGPESLRHSFNAEASPKDMTETYLYAFHALVDAGVEAVMGAYNRTNGEVCCGSPTLMKILREDWGFQGHFTSDCWAVRDFHTNHHVTETAAESAALALNNGCDLNCGCTYVEVMKAYSQGLIKEETIRESAVRLFTSRYLLGTMEPCEFDSIPYTVVECSEHLKKSAEATRKACVLLKNDGILPLDASKLRTVGVIGPNANSRVALIGNYHGTSSRYTTVLEGLQDALGDDVRVLYSEGCHLFKDRVEPLAQPDDRLAEALTVAENSDVVILVLGLDETLEGEEGDTGNADASGDKVSLLLPVGQRRLADAMLETGKPVITVLMAGSAIDLGEAAERSNAVLLTWYPGARGGRTVADLLLGKASPSGKLPVTFYHNKQLYEMPPFTDYSMKDRTYRYFKGEPCYPFGYGLTYGDVHAVSGDAQRLDNGDIRVRITLMNTGKMDTEEVAQVYVQNDGSENAALHPHLAAFRRVFVPAGGQTEVELVVPKKCTLVVDKDGCFREEGRLILYAGVGQPDARTERLTGHAAVRMELD